MYRYHRCDTLNDLGEMTEEDYPNNNPKPASSSQSTPNSRPQKSLPSTPFGLRNIVSTVSMTPMDNRDGGGGESSSVVHGSLENLHHPTNYRSTSRRRKSHAKKKHSNKKQMDFQAGEFIREKMKNNEGGLVTPQDEIQMLYMALDEERKKIMLRRAACSFLYGALKRQTEKVAILETKYKGKAEEAAARLILHNLLLNAFRQRDKEMESLIKDNVELHKNVENLSLQVRVVRHLQSTEKQKNLEKDHEIKTLTDRVAQLKERLDTAEAQLATVESESRRAHVDKHRAEEDTRRIHEEMSTLREQYDFANANLEMEKNRSAKLSKELSNQKHRVSEMKRELDELNSQSSNWQERARSFESLNWELTQKLQERDRELKECKLDCKNLNDALFEDKEKKVILKKENEDLQTQLRCNNKEASKIKKAYTALKRELDQITLQNSILLESAKQTKKDHDIVHSELMEYKLRNLRKRRMWANFLVTLVSPFEVFRYLFAFQPRELPMSSTNDLPLDPRQF